jgi:RHS repeat-associated protein
VQLLLNWKSKILEWFNPYWRLKQAGMARFGEQTYETQWTYDTWNRLTSMLYADGEQVGYTYNVGGLLRSMDGKKKNSTYSYVKQLGYDKFEQRLFLAYGNGTKTTYNYEPGRRRLKNMTAQTSAKRLFMDNVYTYDKVNNILNLTNNAPVPTPNLMGGSSEYNYSYDDLYRLTTASGTFKGANDDHAYTLSMSYNSVGGITQKNQNHTRKGTVEKKTTYDMTYTYGQDQPHAPIHIGQQAFTYDANGNQLGWKDDKTGQRRNILWDEENRIRAVYDNGAYYHYTYDAAGERVLKGQSTGQRVFVNGQWKAGSGQMGNYTVYVNPYIVLRSGGYTKHYYIEGQRIVSKLGGGWNNTGQGPLQAGNGKVDYAGRGQKVFDGIVKNLKFLGADGQILTAGKSGKIPPGQVNGTGNVTEAFRYFYHPDHLGSTSYVTDASGEVYQHLEYFAFGETFVEEHSNTNRTPYLYNSKELDEETGLYYYGARYYDPRTSVWQSVDPKMDKYPGVSPYNYCLNNPLILLDPNGADVIIAFTGGPTGGGKTLSPENAGTTGKIVLAAQAEAQARGIKFSGTVIAPGWTAGSAVSNAYDFIKANYTPGEKVIVYGYSYGGDFAVELAEKLKVDNITVNLLITVDATDGPLQNSTINKTIPDNVEVNQNIYQTNDSGTSSSSRSTDSSSGSSSSGSSGSSSSNSGSSNSPGSNGGPNKAEDSSKTRVINNNMTGKKTTHGNIDENNLKSNIQSIKNFMTPAPTASNPPPGQNQ